MKTKFSRGFMTVSLVIWLPLLLSLLLGVYAITHIRKEHMSRLHECRKSLMQAQKYLAEGVRDVLSLNPRVQYWHLRRLQAEQRLRAALAVGSPPAIAAATAVKSYVIVQQLKLRSQQEHSRLRSLLSAQKTTFMLRKSQISRSTIRSSVSSPTWNLKGQALDDIAVLHSPLPLLEKRSQLSSQWSFSLKRLLLPLATQNLRTRTQIDIHQFECNTHLEKKGTLWMPALGPAKWL